MDGPTWWNNRLWRSTTSFDDFRRSSISASGNRSNVTQGSWYGSASSSVNQSYPFSSSMGFNTGIQGTSMAPTYSSKSAAAGNTVHSKDVKLLQPNLRPAFTTAHLMNQRNLGNSLKISYMNDKGNFTTSEAPVDMGAAPPGPPFTTTKLPSASQSVPSHNLHSNVENNTDTSTGSEPMKINSASTSSSAAPKLYKTFMMPPQLNYSHTSTESTLQKRRIYTPLVNFDNNFHSPGSASLSLTKGIPPSRFGRRIIRPSSSIIPNYQTRVSFDRNVTGKGNFMQQVTYGPSTSEPEDDPSVQITSYLPLAHNIAANASAPFKETLKFNNHGMSDTEFGASKVPEVLETSPLRTPLKSILKNPPSYLDRFSIPGLVGFNKSVSESPSKRPEKTVENADAQSFNSSSVNGTPRSDHFQQETINSSNIVTNSFITSVSQQNKLQHIPLRRSLHSAPSLKRGVRFNMGNNAVLEFYPSDTNQWT